MPQTAEGQFWLILKSTPYGSLSFDVRKKEPGIAADEIKMLVNVAVPMALFKKPALRATLAVAEGTVPQITSEMILDVEEALAKVLPGAFTLEVITPPAPIGTGEGAEQLD